MKKVTKNAIFEYEKDDSSLVIELARYIDDNAKRIYDFFEMNESIEKPVINIIQSKKELDEIHRRFNDLDSTVDVPKWIIGFSSSDMQIYYLSLNDYKNTSHAFDKSDYDIQLISYKKTILHEFIHYVNRYFCKINNCEFSSKFLAEGVAQYLSKQNEGIVLNFNYSLDDILNSNNCYNGCYLVTKYIIEKYPSKYMLDLLKDRNKAKHFLEKSYESIKEYYSKQVANYNSKNNI